MAGSAARPFVVTDYVSVDPKNPGIVVPIDETFLNALACQYIADPKSKLAFEMYLKGDMYQNCFDVERKLGMKDITSGMIDAEHMLHPNYRKWCRERAWMAEDLAAEYIGYDELMTLANKYKELYNKTSDPTQKLMHMLVLTRLTDTFLPKANQAADNDANYRLLKGFLDNINKGDIYNNAAAAHAEPVSEPFYPDHTVLGSFKIILCQKTYIAVWNTCIAGEQEEVADMVKAAVMERCRHNPL